MKKFNFCFALSLLLLFTFSLCNSYAQIITRDNDDRHIKEPAYDEEGDFIWSDGAYFMAVHQLKKLLTLSWYLGKKEAENRNAIDEVPDST